MNIVQVRLDTICIYENNAKIHTDTQIEQIIKSIQEFGFNDPIALDENNRIIEGHGRYFAAKKLNIQEVPCIYLKHLDDEQKKAYILAHNKLTMNTGFDFDLLQEELKSIDGIDMSDFGFEIVNYEDVEDFFASENESPKEKEHPKHTCPECGHEF